MMLVGGGLRILHATLHERILDALMRLTPELIEEAGLAWAATLSVRPWRLLRGFSEEEAKQKGLDEIAAPTG